MSLQPPKAHLTSLRTCFRLTAFYGLAMLLLAAPQAQALELAQGHDQGKGQDENRQIAGRYVGHLELFKTGEQIPLQISLNFVESFGGYDRPDNESLPIGAFLIDDEGGPFPFSNVTFNMIEGRLDLKYKKPENNRISNIPADFRFTGHFNSDRSISGEARSGRHGAVGSFQLKRTDDKFLQRQSKYTGTWKATTPVWDRDFYLVVTDSPWHTVNPQDYDLDFSPGKIGYFGSPKFPKPIRRVYIDYIDRTINFISNDNQNAANNLNLIVKFLDDGTTEAVVTAPYSGGNDKFFLKKVSSSEYPTK